jgi:hypothetical protein
VGGLIPKTAALSFGASLYGKALPVRFYLIRAKVTNKPQKSKMNKKPQNFKTL